MINHSRPRQTTWEYNQEEDAFIITALTKLYAGNQIMDSYGRRDNRRLFFCYGFVEDDNLDGNGCSPNTVSVAICSRHPTSMNDCERPIDAVTQSTEELHLDEDEDCGFFWNSMVMDVMDQVDAGTEDVEVPQEILPSTEDRNLGAQVSYRMQWVLAHSKLISNNLYTIDHDCLYDHADSQYAFLSMCYDDAGMSMSMSFISFCF